MARGLQINTGMPPMSTAAAFDTLISALYYAHLEPFSLCGSGGGTENRLRNLDHFILVGNTYLARGTKKCVPRVVIHTTNNLLR